MPVLPPHTEAVGVTVWSGEKYAQVVVRRWSPDVRPELAEAGVARLVALMYDAAREPIVLPQAVAELVVGGYVPGRS